MEQPSLRTIRNQAEWKSYNYGIKETTSIGLVGGVEMCNRLVPYPRLVDKNLGGISVARSPRPVPGPPDQYQEDSSPQLLATKTCGDWVTGRNCWDPMQFLLKNPHTDSPTQTHSLWAPVTGWWLERHQWYTGRNWSAWDQAGRGHCPFSEPSPHRTTESQSQEVDAISETSSTWLTLFALLWISLEALSHSSYRHTHAVNSDFSIRIDGLSSWFKTS